MRYMAFAILPCYRSVNRCVTAHRHWHKSNALHHTVLLQVCELLRDSTQALAQIKCIASTVLLQVCELLRDASLAQIECIAYTALNYRSANCCVTHHWHKSNALYHTVLLQVRELLRDGTRALAQIECIASHCAAAGPWIAAWRNTGRPADQPPHAGMASRLYQMSSSMRNKVVPAGDDHSACFIIYCWRVYEWCDPKALPQMRKWQKGNVGSQMEYMYWQWAQMRKWQKGNARLQMEYMYWQWEHRQWEHRQKYINVQWEHRQKYINVQWEHRQKYINVQWEHRQNVQWEHRQKYINVQWEHRQKYSNVAYHTTDVEVLQTDVWR